VNKNALPGTYIGNETVTTGDADAFQVNVLELNTDTDSEQNGLPTFNAKIQGVSVNAAYYLMDFNSDHSVVWNVDCM